MLNLAHSISSISWLILGVSGLESYRYHRAHVPAWRLSSGCRWLAQPFSACGVGPIPSL